MRVVHNAGFEATIGCRTNSIWFNLLPLIKNSFSKDKRLFSWLPSRDVWNLYTMCTLTRHNVRQHCKKVNAVEYEENSTEVIVQWSSKIYTLDIALNYVGQAQENTSQLEQYFDIEQHCHSLYANKVLIIFYRCKRWEIGFEKKSKKLEKSVRKKWEKARRMTLYFHQF